MRKPVQDGSCEGFREGWPGSVFPFCLVDIDNNLVEKAVLPTAIEKRNGCLSATLTPESAARSST
jgi:hypothetical protein